MKGMLRFNEVELVEVIGAKGLIPTIVEEVLEGEDALRVRRQKVPQKSIHICTSHAHRLLSGAL